MCEVRLLVQRGEADCLKRCARFFVAAELQKCLGGVDVLGNIQNRRRVDNLTAHFGGGVIGDGQARREGIGAVDDAAVNGRLGDLRGDLLDARAVGDGAGSCQRFLVELIELQNLLGVLTDGVFRFDQLHEKTSWLFVILLKRSHIS